MPRRAPASAATAPRWRVATLINIGRSESYTLHAPDGAVIARAKNGQDQRLREIAQACNSAPELRRMLQRLTEKVSRANSIQHSGGKIAAEDWSELYQLANEAKGLLESAG